MIKVKIEFREIPIAFFRVHEKSVLDIDRSTGKYKYLPATEKGTGGMTLKQCHRENLVPIYTKSARSHYIKQDKYGIVFYKENNLC